MIDQQLAPIVAKQPYPLLFATISGAHLYGFPSVDSDVDLRGVHILPAHEVVGLEPGPETIETTSDHDGTEIDLVTHDLLKFARLMLRRNGYVLEQLFSPHVVQTTPEHDALKAIGVGCITRHHAHHYLGFARSQWKLFVGDARPRIKPLLYVYRVLLTGIHLMRTGEIEANLVRLNAECGFSYLADLIATKQVGEQATLADGDLAFHEREFTRLLTVLEEARDATSLPELPTSRQALHDLVVRIRLATVSAAGSR